MFISVKPVKKSNIPHTGGTLATIAGTDASKLPIQILDFTQDVSGTITIPSENTYGLIEANHAAYNITGVSAACYTNNNSLDITITGDSGAQISSNAKKFFSGSGSGAGSNVGSQGITIATANGTSGYSSFSTTITQSNSGFSGNQSGGNWNVIRENAASGEGTWTATVLNANTTLSGSCDGKALIVTKNGSQVVNLGNSGGSWSVACVPGDELIWTCSAGIGGGGTINRSQNWSWSGSPAIKYTANTNGGSSGTVTDVSITLTNNNSKSLQVTLDSGTTGISGDTNVASGANNTLQALNKSTSNSWTVSGFISPQTVSSILYAGVAAYNGDGVTVDTNGVPSDGITLTDFSGTYNRLI